jgi:CheY-like chemotaxis protein
MLVYAGKSIHTPTQVIMWMLVDDVIHTLKTTLSQNVVINTSYSSDIPSIVADAGQLRQMVMNLIINASEAIGKEQGDIHVSLSIVSIKKDTLVPDDLGESIPAGSYLCLEVTDTGCGMDKETKRRIFEPFYTTKFTGRGLGMSAVLGILKAHKGVLQLFSQTGKGSTIKVCLPLPISEPAADETLNQATAPLPWLGSGTILLVEDEEQVRVIAKIMLEMFGFTVLEAVNGREGLELYGEYGANITLVITDIGMPVMDGYEMFRELKKFNPSLPIIISSGFSDYEVASRIDCGDIAGLISKPYSENQLREVLKSVVEGPV